MTYCQKNGRSNTSPNSIKGFLSHPVKRDGFLRKSSKRLSITSRRSWCNHR